VLLYDLKSHQAHCLNRAAALIWEHCDRKQTVGELARLLEQELGVETGEEVVWLGLRQLNKYHLLQEQMAPGAGPERISRRELGRRLGAATALSLPLIASVAAPTAAQAASGLLPNNSRCEVDAECASNCCVANLCSPIGACNSLAAQGLREPPKKRP
jgi:hypothetical protein